jgi:hypothetical protein
MDPEETIDRTMKIAYLMLVHRNPILLERAVEVLSADEQSAFFVHVDLKSDIGEFSVRLKRSVAMVEPRIAVYWAEFSQVEATMLLIRCALKQSPESEYFILMQGSDYPLRDGIYIRRFFEENYGTEFISMVKMPAPGFPLSKINKFVYPSDKRIRRFLARAMGKLGLAERDYTKYLGGLEAYAGDACWALSRNACEHIIEFSEANPHFEAYFRNAFTSDEVFFHTILGNSAFRARVGRGLLFRDWPSPGNHPEMLNEAHLNFFEAQDEILVHDQFGSGEALFARKFGDGDLRLLDRMDAMIAKKGC